MQMPGRETILTMTVYDLKKSGEAVSVHTAVGLTWNVYIFRYLQSSVKIYFSIQRYDLNIIIRHYNKIFLS